MTLIESAGPAKARLAILLSGRGSNFLALHDAILAGRLPAEIVLVLSNLPEAPGLLKAQERGLATRVLPHRGLPRAEHDRQVLVALREHQVDWICLAGYLRIVGKELVDAYPQRILNIHPSLLPSFPGLDAQKQAFEHGSRVSGCTVHFVDAGLDTGPIVAQSAVSIDDAPSAEVVAARILAVEHETYVQGLGRLLCEPWKLEGRRLVFGAHAEK